MANKHSPDCLNLETVIRSYAAKAALVTPEGGIAYREFLGRIRSVCTTLQERWIKPGDHVAILADNRPETALLIWATWLCGAIAVPLSIRFPGLQVDTLLRELSCRFLVFDESGAIKLKKSPVAQLPLEELFAGPSPALHRPPPEPLLPLDVPATLILTSGSSGAPKAALHNLGNHFYSALGANQNIPLKPGHRWLLSLPLYHVGGLAILMRCFLAGAAVAIPAPGMSLPEGIAALQPTHISLVAAQLIRLMDDPAMIPRLRNMQAILLGGSAIPESLLKRAIKENLPVHTSYGSTEMSSQVCTTPPGADAAVLHTSGAALPYREVRIAENGEILLRGKTRFCGYWRNGRLEQPFDDQGWFASGDCGYFDARGNLAVAGRLDRMFISGGENIHPEEIEQVLERHPQVLQAVVTPVPHPQFGQRPAAFLRTKPHQKPDEPELKDWLRERLPGFKIPDHFFNWPSDLSQTGIKIDRGKFEELALRIVQGEPE